MAIQNIALKKTATASGYVAPYAPSRAVDGLLTPVNRWLCKGVSSTSPATLTVDLGGPSVITSWIVKHMSVAGWASPAYNMSDFKLQGSNDSSTWIDIDVVTNNTADITNRTVNQVVVYRYVRLYVSKGIMTNQQLASLMEFEVYGYPSPYLQGLSITTTVALASLPAFAPTVFTYTTANVPNNISNATITPITQDAQATIRINGTPVNSGTGTPVALNVGSNTITVTVTAADKTTTQAYTVTVVREGTVNANLSGLTISAGAFVPTFSSSIFKYTANVGYSVAAITVTPSASSGASITVNDMVVASGSASNPINLEVGNSNGIYITVTNGTLSNTYKIIVTRASCPYLNTVKVTYAGIRGDVVDTITINENETEYGDNIPDTVISVRITAYAQNTNAVILVNGTQYLLNGQISTAITVNPTNKTRIPIVVTSDIGTDSKAYGITIA